MKEMNYYSLYLEKILLDNDLAMRYGNPFIEARSEQASESYEQIRRNGCTVEQAQELAMSQLLRKYSMASTQFHAKNLSWKKPCKFYANN